MLFNRGDAQAARKLLQEALRLLPTQKHVQTILKFARMEFSYQHSGRRNGDPERARTLLEGILEKKPKATDIWNVYIDMEIKYGLYHAKKNQNKNKPTHDAKVELDKVRRLFERVVSLKLSTKKMQTFFKKWHTFESEYGSEDDVESVKEKARSYVERLAGDNSN